MATFSMTDSGGEFHNVTALTLKIPFRVFRWNLLSSNHNGCSCVCWKALLVNKALEKLLYGSLIHKT
ncbi:hypothetical protein XENTR_v10004090 [Xenopus tropicalis]|nr:hypothetical protein XENTR_v10004090 [Xenopus tropicalis]